MDCRQLISTKCPNGHEQTWRCFKGKPATCLVCEGDKQARAKDLEIEFERQQRRELARQEHMAKLRTYEDQIRLLKQRAMDEQEAVDMEQALEQKKMDLENAKEMRESLETFRNKKSRSPTAEHDDLQGKKRRCSAQKTNEKNMGKASCSQSGDVFLESPSAKNWDRQKQTEGARNSAIDSLMEMTGLEDAKSQILSIKARADVAIRQNIDVKKERFGIVLLGNPGTGERHTRCSTLVLF